MGVRVDTDVSYRVSCSCDVCGDDLYDGDWESAGCEVDDYNEDQFHERGYLEMRNMADPGDEIRWDNDASEFLCEDCWDERYDQEEDEDETHSAPPIPAPVQPTRIERPRRTGMSTYRL